MKNKFHKKRKLHSRKNRMALGFMVAFGIFCLVGGVVVAKYYAGRSNKGVATASSFYFTSNVLKTVDETGEYSVSFNKTAWDGTNACELSVQIRNFQNQLLYNDKNLDVVYDITFVLEGASDGGKYTLSYTDASKQTVTQDITQEAITISGMTLPGGTANYDQFKIEVTRPDSQKTNTNYRSVGVRVTATPVSPSYVANSCTLGGILYATMVSTDYSLTSDFSKVTAALEDYSGFPYTITYMPGVDNAAHSVTITWDSSLEIDQFNSYYNETNNKVTDNNGKQYMTIQLQPYSSIQITFYRASGFNAETIKSVAELEKLVTVVDNDYEPDTTAGAVSGEATAKENDNNEESDENAETVSEDETGDKTDGASSEDNADDITYDTDTNVNKAVCVEYAQGIVAEELKGSETNE